MKKHLIVEWQSRPLDAIYFKVRKDNRIINKAAYTVMAINMEGHKDILGIWIGENESASFWLSICNDLKNRGGRRPSNCLQRRSVGLF